MGDRGRTGVGLLGSNGRGGLDRRDLRSAPWGRSLLRGDGGGGRNRRPSWLRDPSPEKHHQQTAEGINPYEGPALLAMAIQELL
jgi:hypothetical protein